MSIYKNDDNQDSVSNDDDNDGDYDNNIIYNNGENYGQGYYATNRDGGSYK